jgi:hypothetical protein
VNTVSKFHRAPFSSKSTLSSHWIGDDLPGRLSMNQNPNLIGTFALVAKSTLYLTGQMGFCKDV